MTTTPYSPYGPPTTIPGQMTFPAQATPTQTPTTATTTHFTSVLSSANFNDGPSLPGTPTPAGGRGRSRGAATGAKRGRKPRGALATGSASPRPFLTNTFSSTSTGAGGPTSTPTSFTASSPSAQYPKVHWAMPTAATSSGAEAGPSSSPMEVGATGGGLAGAEGSASTGDAASGQTQEALSTGTPAMVIDPALMGAAGTVTSSISNSRRGTPVPDAAAGFMLPGRGLPQPLPATSRATGAALGVDDEAEGDDELLPAMADDDYSAQLSWQSQSKDNLKVLMDNLSPAQYDRFEAYRRHALPKQAVRKVIQQTLGQQVSQPVAQIIAGFSKVFVGEIVEKARAVQTRRGETGPLSPDHLREAYRAYQEETGNVGSARPLRAKKLFVR
ncbi:hypothetical protein GALMADRAFT_252302 [Galerina marginata CBS 339.88]|uniref:Transcription initiation factor TFIID subunit 11 n=1 Tax=Galerina marginata (strain CBS 339.88) TaxID=685588 RepID=A0A067SZ68_GALM3|nr:hypothetical protein GALMADRAFT_252302 [Galerina marginata CBS 339.88]